MKIEIKTYPLLEYPIRGFFAIGIIIFITVLSYLFTKHIVMPFFAFMIMTMPLVNFLFPATYTFTHDEFSKLQLFYNKKIKIDVFDQYSLLDEGILLICGVNKRKNEFIYIFDDEKKEEIIIYLKDKNICDCRKETRS